MKGARGVTLVLALLPAACSSSSTGGAPPASDAGTDSTSSPVDAGVDSASPGLDASDAAVGPASCASYAAAACALESACRPGLLQSQYGTMTACVSALSSFCTIELAAPGSGVTASWIGACQASLTAQATMCASGPSPLPIPAPTDPCAIVGTRVAGDTCGIAAQCQSDQCDRVGSLCGTCATVGQLGDACGTGTGVNCARGLNCSNKNVCAKLVGEGQPCDLGVTSDCVGGTSCVIAAKGDTTGTCMASGAAAGTTCSGKAIAAPGCFQNGGFYCAAAQCAPITYVAPTAACGVADGGGSDDVCSAGGVCTAASCVAPGAAGQPCTAAGCVLTTTCVAGDGGGTCEPVDSSCKAAPDAGMIGLAFQPSNVSVADVTKYTKGAQDENVSSPCSVSTDAAAPSQDCFGSTIEAVKQPDGSTVNLVVVKSLAIQSNGTLNVSGGVPLVIVSLGDATIFGTIAANSPTVSGFQIGPGGSPPAGMNAKGGGPGGGAGSSSSGFVGAGGGAYCGAGGAGGGSSATAAAYGGPDVRTLVGGSGGGGGVINGGAGGGAVQIVSGGTFTMKAGSVITVGGGGGSWGGGGAGQNGGGGGSGGAILLEATTMSIAGTLAANGGGGGGDSSNSGGSDATADATPAAGGAGGASCAAGGAGAAGATAVAGAAGLTSSGINSGGGGGGAGRIRLDSSSGSATVTGATLSPAAGTVCLTQGTLRTTVQGP